MYVTTIAMTANDLPTEIWLNIISYTYSPNNLLNLRLTCRRFHSLIEQHEVTLVKEIRRVHYSGTSTRPSLATISGASVTAALTAKCPSSSPATAPTSVAQLFPNLHLDSYAALSVLHHRLLSLESVHKESLRVDFESSWLRGKWMPVHRVGLLLLYRLVDGESVDAHEEHSSHVTSPQLAGSEGYCHKVALLESLPATSLVCLLFTLIASIRILRVHGPQPIRSTYRRDDGWMKSEIELVFEELLLLHGPSIFVSLFIPCHLCRDQTISLLRAGIASMHERQSPDEDEGGGRVEKPATLLSSLRRCLAEKAGCGVNEVVTRMWEILSGPESDAVDDRRVVRLVGGEEVERSLKRMGF